MSAERYLVYLEGLELTEEEKLIVINYLIELSERLFDVKTR